MGPEGIALEEGRLLAPATTAVSGQTVDGVQCNTDEQVAYHIHTHLTVYVDGTLRPIPAGIGIVAPVAQQTANGGFDSASRCYYWLHVHAQDGIIHVESPTTANYTLGQFFAIWQQPLTPDRVGPATGKLAVFVNGVRYAGNPAEHRAALARGHPDRRRLTDCRRQASRLVQVAALASARRPEPLADPSALPAVADVLPRWPHAVAQILGRNERDQYEEYDRPDRYQRGRQ